MTQRSGGGDRTQPATTSTTEHSQNFSSIPTAVDGANGHPGPPSPVQRTEAESVSAVAPDDPSSSAPTRLERSLLTRLLSTFQANVIRIQLWDGTAVNDHVAGRTIATISIRDRSTLWKLLMSPEYHFMESYAQGTLEIEGDVLALMSLLMRTLNHRQPGIRETVLSRLHNRRTLSGSRQNVASHYDLGNDFYRLWLDEQLVYTCAYYESESTSLEAAQVAKMDYVCRKLRLRPGETVIEAGCGWGALALHMARHYGVNVRAYNISREQLAHARRRAAAEGLDGQVEFVEADWRGITGRCDAFVSVGMLEHVGPEHYHQLGRLIQDSLNPDGRGLIHSIGLNHPMPLNRWIERRIFPGAQPPTLQQMMEIFQPFDLSVLDVENLRLHYAKTLEQWWARFEQMAVAIREMFDETFVRLWRMYLVSSRSAFETGGLQLYQVLFAPANSNEIPLTRAHLYHDGAVPNENPS